MFEIGRLTRLELGYVGETESRSIQIDMREWLDRWPAAVIAIWVRRPDKTDYTAATEVEDGILTWVVTAGDVAQAGDGMVQVKALDPMDTGAIYKSRTVGTKVYASLEEWYNDPDAPDPMEAWANQAAIYKEEAYRAKESAAESAKAAAEAEYRAETYGRQAYESATTAAYQAALSESHANDAERAKQAASAAQQQAEAAAEASTAGAGAAEQSAAEAKAASEAAQTEATRAKEAENAAIIKANQAISSASEAISAANNASESASSASLDRQKAATSSEIAVTAQSKAERSATEASQSAAEAEAARAEAVSAADTATGAAGAAEKSATTAEAAKEAAVTAAETASNAADAAETAAEDARNVLGTTAPGIELAASGEVVQISDGAARPALSLVSQISTVQKGTGDPTPDNIRPIVGWDMLTMKRTSRNMLDAADLRQVQVNTGETRWGMQYTRPGTYALHANVAGGDADYVYARVTDGSGAAVGDTMYLVVGSAIKAYTVTLEAGQTLTVWYVRDLDQATAADCLARTQVQVEMGSRTAYVPGQSAAITAALPETVFGGSLDWTTGMLMVEYELVTLDGNRNGFVQSVNDAGIVNAHFGYSGGWVTEGMQISHFYYLNKPAATTTEECYLAANGSLYLRIARDRLGGETWADVNAYLKAQVAAGTPVQVLHRLKEPRTMQLDPQTLALLRGENRIWSEAGASAVGYIADTQMYVDTHGGGGDAGFAEYAAYAERAGEADNALAVGGLQVQAVPITDWDTITPDAGTMYLIYDPEVTA